MKHNLEKGYFHICTDGNSIPWMFQDDEDFIKGNRRYFTVGAGFHLSIFSLDFAYCIATAASNPLDQTMRFTLGFDLAGIKDMVNNRK